MRMKYSDYDPSIYTLDWFCEQEKNGVLFGRWCDENYDSDKSFFQVGSVSTCPHDGGITIEPINVMLQYFPKYGDILAVLNFTKLREVCGGNNFSAYPGNNTFWANSILVDDMMYVTEDRAIDLLSSHQDSDTESGEFHLFLSHLYVRGSDYFGTMRSYEQKFLKYCPQYKAHKMSGETLKQQGWWIFKKDVWIRENFEIDCVEYHMLQNDKDYRKYQRYMRNGIQYSQVDEVRG